jgi:hypothetical protein
MGKKLAPRVERLEALSLLSQVGGGGASVVTDWNAAAGHAGIALTAETPVTVLSCNLNVTANGAIMAMAHIAISNGGESGGAIELILEVDGGAIDTTTQTMPENVDYNTTLAGAVTELAVGLHTITVVANASVSGMTTQSGGATGCTIIALALIPSGSSEFL